MSVSRTLVRICAVCLCLLASRVLAQGGASPIQIGQNVTGTLTAEASTAQYVLGTNGGETAVVQVLAISPNFAPSFRVLNPAGVEVLNVANPDAKASIVGSVSLSDAGVYTILVQGENGGTGQFLLSLQPGAALPAPTPLNFDQPITAVVGSQTPMLVYRFSTNAQNAVTLSVTSQTPNSGLLIALYDESANKTIASSDASIVGVSYQLPAVDRSYRVEICAADGGGSTPFSICVGVCGGAPQNPAPATAASLPLPLPPSATATAASLPPLPAVTPCTATPSTGGASNLRSGPGTIYTIRGGLPVGQSFVVLGAWKGGYWYEVDANGQPLWVAGSVVNLSGDCSTLPLLDTPPNAQLAPTATPTITPPPQINPTDTPTTTQNLPDLTIINLQISQNVDGNGSLGADVTILNNGTAMLIDNSFAILTCVDGFDNCVENYVAFNLQPGETDTVSYRLPNIIGGGNHSVNVTLDSHNDIDELDKSNNTAFASFNVP